MSSPPPGVGASDRLGDTIRLTSCTASSAELWHGFLPFPDAPGQDSLSRSTRSLPGPRTRSVVAIRSLSELPLAKTRLVVGLSAKTGSESNYNSGTRPETSLTPLRKPPQLGSEATRALNIVSTDGDGQRQPLLIVFAWLRYAQARRHLHL